MIEATFSAILLGSACLTMLLAAAIMIAYLTPRRPSDSAVDVDVETHGPARIAARWADGSSAVTETTGPARVRLRSGSGRQDRPMLPPAPATRRPPELELKRHDDGGWR